MSPDVKPQRRYDIQGLRVIASLLVASYHIWLHRVSGGVDVFFVVSGYLITRSLLGRLATDGRLDVAAFWAGLTRRLLPTAAAVIATTGLLIPFFLPRVQWASTAADGLASLAYVGNWRLALESVDYLARDRTPSPFQHFWALGVQGQFYLLWPFVVLAATRLAALTHRPLTRVLTTLLAAILLVSFAYAAVSTWRDQPFAYFDTGARLWEFALGGLVAVRGARLSARWSPALGWIGLIGIVATGMLFRVSHVFPGPLTLWPTLSAVLILVAGASPHWGVDRVLGHRWLARLGDHSYGFYLWHWPLLVAWRARLGTDDLSLGEGLSVLALAAVLTWITTQLLDHLLERHSAAHAPRQVLLRAGAIGIIAGAVLAGQAAYAHRLRVQEALARRDIDPGAYPGARARLEHWQHPDRHEPVPGPFTIEADTPVSYADGCHQGINNPAPRVCTYGDPNGRVTIALVGGSHSAHWLPALQQLAPTLSLRILNITKSDCWLNDELRPTARSQRSAASCAAWNARIVDVLRDRAPDAVFTTSTRLERDDTPVTASIPAGTEHVPAGYVAKWREIAALGIDVLAIRDTPWHQDDPGQCVDMFGADSPRCQQVRSAVFAPADPSAALLRTLPPRVYRIDLTDALCGPTSCPPVIGNVQVYRDKHHLSATFAATLAPALAPHLERWIAGRERVATTRRRREARTGR